MTPALELDSIGVSYGHRPVLTAATLRAAVGRVTALIGRNGAGKTSLLRAGVGLQSTDHGTVRFFGVLHLRPRLARLARRGLFYLPARDILDPFVSVRQQVTAVSRYFGGATPDEALGLVRLQDIADQSPVTLSGGELRRAEIAVAVARRPRCLVADEPFRGLDPLDVELVGGGIRGLRQGGCAVVLTGHELTHVRALADTVVWCAAGTTRQFATAGEAWADAQLQQEFLGVGAPHPLAGALTARPPD